ncbi:MULTISPECIES: hypothetical protein [unclassified Mucilaginibacter]|nr:MULTISPECIES: hypothetical protein [unclassified Mucilaginibacter]MEB0262529.1 hypothetical protein [Mucilaginibacter sp. 10I4]MEB0277982.1 hypothetical protein [Mucilaginibacter sp. 10B2]MEB0299665.1 hypothetical protein [Mucilaginibacter sp. 5C4]WPX22871.1 hypothetical protein RHM67_16450 [Mucilaginibacter sp. 5C4]
MSNKAKKISAGAIIAIAFLTYQLGKDIVKIGIKDGKATQMAITKK